MFTSNENKTIRFFWPSSVDCDHVSANSLRHIPSTCLLWAYAAGQAVNGNLGDKFGGRRMMSLEAVVSCGLNWMVSFGTNVTSLLVPWTINGYFQAMGWAPGSRVLSNWWSKTERGKVYGCYVFAAGMSSVLSYFTSLIVIDFLDLGWEDTAHANRRSRVGNRSGSPGFGCRRAL